MSIFAEMWAILSEAGDLIYRGFLHVILWGVFDLENFRESFFDYGGIKRALNTKGAWALGVLFVVIGGYLIHIIYRSVPFLARNLERFVMIFTYLAMAIIICTSVVREFLFKSIFPIGTRESDLSGIWLPIYKFFSAYPLSWATSIPPLLFMVLVWFACSYNVGSRSHLAFSEFRMRFSRPAQFACLTLDLVLWLAISLIIIVGGLQLTFNSASNFSPVDDTNFKLMNWWFFITLPLSFVLLSGRAFGVWFEDLKNYQTGKPLIKSFVIGGED